MCDYSLQHLASRPAKVGDKLVSTKFTHSLTGGFCAVGEPRVAVCVQPGTDSLSSARSKAEQPCDYYRLVSSGPA